MPYQNEVAFLNVLATMQAQQTQPSPSFRKELVGITRWRRRCEAPAKASGSHEQAAGSPSGRHPVCLGGGSPHPPAKHSRCPQESAERRGNCLKLNPRLCLPRLRGQTPSNAWRSHSPAPQATKSRCMSGYSAFLRLGQQMPRSSPGESPPNQPSRPLKPAAK